MFGCRFAMYGCPCARNLSSCKRNLSSCKRNLSSCKRNLSSCKRNLSSCRRGTCRRARGTCPPARGTSFRARGTFPRERGMTLQARGSDPEEIYQIPENQAHTLWFHSRHAIHRKPPLVRSHHGFPSPKFFPPSRARTGGISYASLLVFRAIYAYTKRHGTCNSISLSKVT